MKTITVEELYKYCQKQIKKGNKDKKILISDDEEGNGYHELIYSFMDAKELEDDMWLPLPVEKEELKEYIILG